MSRYDTLDFGMRTFFIIVSICFVWLSSIFYVSGHMILSSVPGDVLTKIQGNDIYLPFTTSVIIGFIVSICLYFLKDKVYIFHMVPLIVSICLCIGVAIFIGYSLYFRSMWATCNSVHQVSIDTIMSQSQTVLADPYVTCSASYEVLMEWETCLQKSEAGIPVWMTDIVRPFVSSVMMFFREKNKDIEVLKHEHDLRCKDYQALLFFPFREDYVH